MYNWYRFVLLSMLEGIMYGFFFFKGKEIKFSLKNGNIIVFLIKVVWIYFGEVGILMFWVWLYYFDFLYRMKVKFLF